MTVRVNVKLMFFLYHAQQLLLYLLAPFHMPVPVLSLEMTRSASYPQPLRRKAQPSLPPHSFTHCTNRMQGLNRRGCPAVALASEVGWATLKIEITNHKTAQTSARSIRVAGRTLPASHSIQGHRLMCNSASHCSVLLVLQTHPEASQSRYASTDNKAGLLHNFSAHAYSHVSKESSAKRFTNLFLIHH
jgi:hypothetical protein